MASHTLIKMLWTWLGSDRWTPGPATVTGLVTGANLGYALLEASSVSMPGSPAARLFRKADAPAAALASRILTAVGASTCGSAAPFPDAYEKLVVVESIAAIVVLLASAPTWSGWARRLLAAPRWANIPANQIDDRLAVRQGLALLGVGACGWLLFRGDSLFAPSICAHPPPWLLLRPALYISIAFGFACFAAAFGVARR